LDTDSEVKIKSPSLERTSRKPSRAFGYKASIWASKEFSSGLSEKDGKINFITDQF
jgi:hypothetical protein